MQHPNRHVLTKYKGNALYTDTEMSPLSLQWVPGKDFDMVPGLSSVHRPIFETQLNGSFLLLVQYESNYNFIYSSIIPVKCLGHKNGKEIGGKILSQA